MILKVIIVSLLILFVKVKANLGDSYPFCKNPDQYPPSLQTFQGTINLASLQGYWYEIMLSTNLVENNSQCGKLILSQNNDGSVEMDVQYLMKDNSWKTVNGKATFTNSQKTKIKFSSTSLQTQNFWILDYSSAGTQYLLLGEPCRMFFWLFGKTTDVPPDFVVDRIQFLTDINYTPAAMAFRDADCSSKFF